MRTLNEWSAQITETIGSFRFIDEDKVLSTDDFLIRNTRDPRPRYAHLPFAFKDHEYQRDILRDHGRLQCCMKCSQIGLSELFMRKALAFVVHHNLNVGYVMPTKTMLQKFIPSRLDLIIESSPRLKAAITISNTEHKRFVNGASLFLLYSNSPTATISTSLDAVFLDELDQYSEGAADAWPQRLGHSEFKIDGRFSTPTFDGFGISGLYDTSDKKQYLVKCSACGKWQSMSFPGSICFAKGLVGLPDFSVNMSQRMGVDKLEWKKRYMDREPYIGCLHCSKPLDRSEGNREWVAEHPGRELSGRQLSRFDIVTHSARTIIDDFFVVRGLRQFYNQVLGKAFSEERDALSETVIKAALAPVDADFRDFQTHSTAQTYLGIDQGKGLHLVLIQKLGQEFRVVALRKLSMVDGERETFVLSSVVRQIKDICQKFRVRRIICDAAPDINLPRALATAMPGKVWWAYFNHSVDGFVLPTEDRRNISINRTWMLSSVADMLRKFHSEYVLTLPSGLFDTALGAEFAQHLLGSVRVEIERKDKDGNATVRTSWQKKTSMEDHFFLALGYAYAAFEGDRKLASRDVSAFMTTGVVVVDAPDFI